MYRPRHTHRRGSVIVIVLWCLSVAALVASSLQLFSYRQATLGRDVLHRTQARWAARSGVESTIAMLALHTEQPIPDDAFALTRDLEYVWTGELYDAVYDILHHVDGRDWRGPLDEHSRMNLNGADTSSFGLLEDLTPDVGSALKDWIDPDEDAGLLGGEEDYYETLSNPYKPRNGPLRNVAEMELVAGIWGDFVRGEDWNMNNRLDPNEDDGLRTLPEDEPDGVLEPGWQGRVTVHSRDDGATISGYPRIRLKNADPVELMNRCGIDEQQAEILIAFGGRDDNDLGRLLTAPITNIDESGRITDDEVNAEMAGLTEEQLRAVLAETQIRPHFERQPGKMNLNTVSPELIREFLVLRGIDEVVADEIIFLRDSRAEGLTSVVDLKQMPGVDSEMLETLSQYFTTYSNVYTISSRGRSSVSGAEIEIIAVVDRSSLPVTIIEYREQ